ncbi:hypothetical protein D3C85_1035720 [compost metagenome]
MKARGTDVSILKYRFIFIFRSEAMRRIKNHLQGMCVCDFLNRLDVAGITVYMSGQDCRSFWCNGPFNFSRIDIKSFLINIYKHWCTTFPYNTVRGGHKRKGGGDNFTFQVQRFDCDLQGHSTIRNIKQVLDVQIVFQLQFQFIYQWSIISEPLSLPNTAHIRFKFLNSREKGFGYRYHLFRINCLKSRIAASLNRLLPAR